MRYPSIKTLKQVFGDNAKEARQILESTRSQLEERPECMERIRECYHPPAIWDLKLTALDKLAGTSGIEYFRLKNGGYCEYLNAGDTYTVTLLRVDGKYRVGCWGDIAERFAD